jgi:Putative Flp pilus-assembly TadE/G-like/von Willebrand factor type A domain
VAPIPREHRGRAVAAAAGQTLPLVVVFMFSILVFAGLVIDFGNAYRVQKALQASADASAAAGAGQLTLSYPPITANATAQAQKYGSQTGGVNPIAGVPAANVTQNVSVTCAQQVGYDCTGGYPNTVTVDETANVPTYLLKLLGFPTITLKAHAQACSPCGGVPLDVMVVLDRTGSMSANNKLPQAKAGINAFMKTMDPTLDNVGLAVLPPAASQAAACSDPDPVFNAQTTIGPDGRTTVYSGAGGTYSSPSASYVLVPLSNTYATSTGNLNSSSPFMSTLNCLQAGGSTAYAEAIDAAYQELVKDGRAGTQKVIVILSDGAANDAPNTLPATSPYRTNPCGQGVTSAGVAKANKVLIYSIAYTANGDECDAAVGAKIGTTTVKWYATVNKANGFSQNYQTPETPTLPAETALQEIASPGSQYFYDLPSATSLTGIFQQIASDIAGGTARIVQ